MAELVEVLPLQMELGECPLWDHRHGHLYWVDILRFALFQRDWASGTVRSWPLPAPGGGLALLGKHDLLVATQTGLFRFAPVTGKYGFILQPEHGRPTNRLNEGKTDPSGNFWIGSISMLGRRPEGSLYRISTTGKVRQMLANICVPNALVFLPLHQMIFADSHLRVIWGYRYDPASGRMSNRQVFIDESHCDWIPDGAVADRQGNVWNAKFGGGRVNTYNDKGGQIAELRLPTTQVTSCVFCGPGLDHLAVTTAKRLLDDQQRRLQPEAGNLFIFKMSAIGCEEPVCHLV